MIDKRISNGYLIKDFLNQEELNYFYSPESIKRDKKNSPDSLKYRVFEDTINRKTDNWALKNMASDWIAKFSGLVEGKAGNDLSRESLKARQDEYMKLIKTYDNKFDSLWKAGVILKEMIGEKNAVRFRIEADTAIGMVTRDIFVNFKDYSIRIIMPGKLIGTNGFIDKTEILLWPVKSDYFMTEPYEMWAESKMPNKWAWIVTGVFIIFVITGLTIRLFRKK